MNSKLLIINSYYRQSGTITDCFIEVPNRYITCTDKQHIKISVVNFIVKRNWYNIQTYNDSFEILENGTDLFVITLTHGSPNVKTITTDIETKINSAISLTGNPTNYTYSVSYEQSTLQFVFSAVPKTGKTLGTIEMKFSNPLLHDTAHEILGFEYTDYLFNIVAGSGSLILNSARIIDVSGEECLYIHLTGLTSKNIEVNGTASIISDVLAIVPCNVTQTGGTLYYGNINDDYSIDIYEKDISQIHLRITNENNEIIELMSDYQLVLKFYIVDDEEKQIEKLIARTNEYLYVMFKQNKMSFDELLTALKK